MDIFICNQTDTLFKGNVTKAYNTHPQSAVSVDRPSSALVLGQNMRKNPPCTELRFVTHTHDIFCFGHSSMYAAVKYKQEDNIERSILTGKVRIIKKIRL